MMTSALRSSSAVSSNGTKPTRDVPVDVFTKPVSRASTTAARMSSAPRVMDTMTDSMGRVP